MKRSFDLSLHGLKLPTANDRLHWRARAELVKTARETLKLQAASELNRLRLDRCGDERRALSLLWVRTGRQQERDADNAVAAMKPLVDALVDAGWLRGDEGKWLEYWPVRQQRGVEPRVYVEIWTTTSSA